MAETLLESSAGNFIYLHYAINDVGALHKTDARSLTMPEGLANYYEQQWERIGNSVGDRKRREQMCCICFLAMSPKPLPISALIRKNSPDVLYDFKKLLDEWAMFLKISLSSDDEPLYSIYHWTFAEFLLDKQFANSSLATEEARRNWLDRKLRRLGRDDA